MGKCSKTERIMETRRKHSKILVGNIWGWDLRVIFFLFPYFTFVYPNFSTMNVFTLSF